MAIRIPVTGARTRARWSAATRARAVALQESMLVLQRVETARYLRMKAATTAIWTVEMVAAVSALLKQDTNAPTLVVIHQDAVGLLATRCAVTGIPWEPSLIVQTFATMVTQTRMMDARTRARWSADGRAQAAVLMVRILAALLNAAMA